MEDWEHSEQKTAKNFRGKRTPASGSQGEKLDIIGGDIFEGLRLENKFTEKKSRSISLAEIDKAFKQAISHSCQWAFLLDFGGKRRVILVDESHYIGLVEENEHLHYLLTK